MTDHKFEPFQQVLVRNRNYHPWEPMHYGYAKDGEHVCAGNPYQQCLPYTPETAHLLGTSQPYEVLVDEATRFECGEWVEVNPDGAWQRALYLKYEGKDAPHCVFVFGTLWNVPPSLIRKASL